MDSTFADVAIVPPMNADVRYDYGAGDIALRFLLFNWRILAAQCNQEGLAAVSRYGRAHAGRRPAEHAPQPTGHARRISHPRDRPRHVLLLRGVCNWNYHRAAAAAASRAYSRIRRPGGRRLGGDFDSRPFR